MEGQGTEAAAAAASVAAPGTPPARPPQNNPPGAGAAPTARFPGILGTFWYALAFPLPLALYAPLQTGATAFYMGALNRRLCSRILTTDDGHLSFNALRAVFDAVNGSGRGLGAAHVPRERRREGFG